MWAFALLSTSGATANLLTAVRDNVDGATADELDAAIASLTRARRAAAAEPAAALLPPVISVHKHTFATADHSSCSTTSVAPT
jgi:hypothetical protein